MIGKYILLLISMSMLFLAGCFGGGSNRSGNMEQQIQQHDQQLRQLQPAQADAQSQLESMRQELNVLKGQLDDLKNVGGAQALVDKVNKHDAAMRQIENNMAMDLNLGDPMATQPIPVLQQQGTVTGGPETVMPITQGQVQNQMQPQTPSGNVPTYGMPDAQTGMQTQPYGNIEPTSGNQTVPVPSQDTWGKESPKPQVEVPQKDISLALFDAGVNSFNARKYDEAKRSFSDFLQNYKGHNLSADAQFYLADCHFQQNKFADAALAYDVVIKNYPKSSRAPGAFLKQAICFSKSNQNAAAKARMQELIKKFPNAPEAARAKTFLKTNK